MTLTFPHETPVSCRSPLWRREVAMVMMLFWLGPLRSSERPRRRSMTVVVSVIAAVACTVCSAITSWRFADDCLGMHNTVERTVFFATGELALVASALMARQHLHVPRRETGAADVLVWVNAPTVPPTGLYSA